MALQHSSELLPDHRREFALTSNWQKLQGQQLPAALSSHYCASHRVFD